jgi:pentatricopeptide repeat protein
VNEVYRRLEQVVDSGNLKPNRITFNTLISAAGKANEWERALQFYETMVEMGISPDKARALPSLTLARCFFIVY